MFVKLLSLATLIVFASKSSSQAADIRGLDKGTPEMKSATTLAFGPDDILFVGDAKAATLFAIATGDMEGDASKASINIENLPKAIEEVLHAAKVEINDLAVNPHTGSAFVAVSADDKAALVKIDGGGKITPLSLINVSYSKVALTDAPEDKVTGEGRRIKNNRMDSITDIAFLKTKFWCRA